MQLAVVRLADHDSALNLAAEEELFHSLPADGARLLFYVNAPCIVLGRSNTQSLWINQAAAEQDGLPIVRRFSGGGAVYHDLDNLNYSFMLPRAWLHVALARHALPSNISGYIAYFRRLLIRALEQITTGTWAEAGISDITLNGRKVSGNAQRVAARGVLHHGTLMLRCPLAAIERYLPVPPNRPGVAHRDFISGLQEEGQQCSMQQLEAAIEGELQQELAVSSTKG